MKWFQMEATAPDDPKIKAFVNRRLMTQGAEAAAAFCGRLWLLWCHVAAEGQAEPGLSVKADGRPIDLFDLSVVCLLPDEAALAAFLDELAGSNLIHQAVWKEKQLVFLPAMWKRATEYYRQRRYPISRHDEPEQVVAAILAGESMVRRIESLQIPERVRGEVYQRDGYCCRYCGVAVDERIRTVDHVIPLVQGGPHTEANFVTACKRCNGKKGGRTPEQAGMVLRARVVNGGSTGGQPLADITNNKQQTTNPEVQTLYGPVGHPAPGLLEAAGPDQADALVTVWNAERKPGPRVGHLNPTRRRAILKAMKAHPDLTVWRQVIQWINTQRWMNAQGTGDHPNWRADLDFLCKPGKFDQIADRMQADRGAVRADGTEGRNATKGRTGFKRGEFAAALSADDDATADTTTKAIH